MKRSDRISDKELLALVHKRLVLPLKPLCGPKIRLYARVVEAGLRTPSIVSQGNRTPTQFIRVVPDGAESANSTTPSDIVRIDVGSLTWGELEWLPDDHWTYGKRKQDDVAEERRERAAVGDASGGNGNG